MKTSRRRCLSTLLIGVAISLAGCRGCARDDDGRGAARTTGSAAPAWIRGQVLHIYDLRTDIINPDRKGVRYVALFDPARASQARESDHTIELIPEDQVTKVMPLGPANIAPFSEFARAHGLVLDELPLDGVWRVHEDGTGYHAHEGGCGDFSVDIDGGDAGGPRNEDFAAYGRPVHAPVAGRVSIAVSDQPDHPPSVKRLKRANRVYIDLPGAFSVGLLHFGQGTLTTTVGADVVKGTPLGRVGNSGSSYAPHFHIGLFWRGVGAPKGTCDGWSVPYVFRRLYVSDHNGGAKLSEWVYPKTGTWISNTPF